VFDEGGAVLVCASRELEQALLAYQWQRAFIDLADHWAHARLWLFGHALLERLLQPTPGITTKCMLASVDSAFFGLDFGIQRQRIDGAIAAYVDHAPFDPQALAPLPLLGIPGWFPNQDPAFYADLNYFRPQRRSEQGLVSPAPRTLVRLQLAS
jgi:hypothetical protein